MDYVHHRAAQSEIRKAEQAHRELRDAFDKMQRERNEALFALAAADGLLDRVTDVPQYAHDPAWRDDRADYWAMYDTVIERAKEQERQENGPDGPDAGVGGYPVFEGSEAQAFGPGPYTPEEHERNARG